MKKRRAKKKKPVEGSKEHFAEVGRKLARRYADKPLWWLHPIHDDKDAKAHDLCAAEETATLTREYLEYADRHKG